MRMDVTWMPEHLQFKCCILSAVCNGSFCSDPEVGRPSSGMAKAIRSIYAEACCVNMRLLCGCIREVRILLVLLFFIKHPGDI